MRWSSGVRLARRVAALRGCWPCTAEKSRRRYAPATDRDARSPNGHAPPELPTVSRPRGLNRSHVTRALITKDVGIMKADGCSDLANAPDRGIGDRHGIRGDDTVPAVRSRDPCSRGRIDRLTCGVELRAARV